MLVAFATAAAGLSVWFIRKSGKRKAEVRQRKQVLYASVIPAADKGGRLHS